MRKMLTFLLAITLFACFNQRVSPYNVPPDRAAAIKMHASPNTDGLVGDGDIPYMIDGLAVHEATDSSSGRVVGYYVERPTPHAASNYEIVPVNVPDGMNENGAAIIC